MCVYEHLSFDPSDPQSSTIESCPQDSAMTRAVSLGYDNNESRFGYEWRAV